MTIWAQNRNEGTILRDENSKKLEERILMRKEEYTHRDKILRHHIWYRFTPTNLPSIATGTLHKSQKLKHTCISQVQDN
jgi:hypothetical protein